MPPRAQRVPQGQPAAVSALIGKLKRNEIIALGSHAGFPNRLRHAVASVPRQCTVAQYERIVQAAFASRRVAIVIFSGAAVPAGGHSRVLQKIAKCLPASRVVCLNVGEFTDADEASLLALEHAVERSCVGNLYLNDPLSAPERARKTRLKAMIKVNKRKERYREQLARTDTWDLLRVGCNAWFNPTAAGRAAAETWLNDDFPQRCKRGCAVHNPNNPGPGRRCSGTNANGQRCCLCTRHASRFCHHHRIIVG